ncbi:Ribokinase-like protein [Thamnocephalis sphaerospora]|uniref:ATP-dependent (S)-NAD(P)H-hydrate dehydratase n=1 Tax=Thamnocephalis sphaerospora TaxID=78915 RepID=A0A4P9XM10_9FUNG|nr:Ribokinase-like protein [Thamnocephalis sphaerospora]|eukprot:RKP06872.1 Ribokinase-like protein [Thamnocephalis sphaerospora]
MRPSLEKIRQLIPPLSQALHKGQAGSYAWSVRTRVYTGAPFFSAMSSMKLGADLAHVVCDPGAAIAIKVNLIVHPYMRTTSGLRRDESDQDVMPHIVSLLERLHVLVVGPGLSRDETMQCVARQTVAEARKRNIPVVLDADAIYMVQHHPDTVRGYRKAVLTPNVNEFKRLCEALDIPVPKPQDKDAAGQLSRALGGVTVVQKGSVDVVVSPDTTYTCDVTGSPRRVGGQGDVLSGLIAAFLAWGQAYQKKIWEHDGTIAEKEIIPLACYAACLMTRECAQEAFKQHRRAMLASDMLAHIGGVFDRLFSEPPHL